jgi:hypothetical protein
MVYCHTEEKWYCKENCNLIYHSKFVGRNTNAILIEENDLNFTYWSKDVSVKESN